MQRTTGLNASTRFQIRSAIAGFLALLAIVHGCQCDTERVAEPRFPAALVADLLDATPQAADLALREQLPGSVRVAGSFMRYTIVDNEVLDEITLFRSIRSGRVDSVIVKYKADLTPKDRKLVLKQAGHPDLDPDSTSDEVVELPHGPNLVIRVRRADRFGRLTITIEAKPPP